MPEIRPLTDIDACMFDAYGTLFDVGSAVARCGESLGNKVAPLVSLWRSKQVAYAWLRSLMGEYTDFWHVTGNSLDSAMSHLGIRGDALRSRLMELWLRLDVFPDVKDVLGGLKEAGMKTAILSNGSTTMLTAAVRNADINELLSQVISVDAVKIFKPHPDAYQIGVDRLKVPAERTLFVASSAWDAAAAANFGFRSVWVNRNGEEPENLPGKPEFTITSLKEVPKILGL
ncbi:MAG: haloacid dehalogenase type II [Rhodospirillales bacterium]|nr:haloacid dehalogenase type II [Rhodospirillales bacterium]